MGKRHQAVFVTFPAAPAPAATQVPPHRDRPTLPLPVGQLGPFQPLRPVGKMNLLHVVGFAGSIITG
jgi:hypothetical protein